MMKWSRWQPGHVPRTARFLLAGAWVAGGSAVMIALALASGPAEPTATPGDTKTATFLEHRDGDDAEHANTIGGIASDSLPIATGASRAMVADDDLLVPDVAEDEDAGEGAVPAPNASDEERVVPAGSGRFTHPLDDWSYVTDRYGADRGGGFVHGGIDLALSGGLSRSPIFSACTGTVSVSQYSRVYGYYVVVDCGSGWATLYAHMSQVYAAPGQKVDHRSALGRTGNSGFSTGEHLHFEILRHGARVNPEHYLDFNIPPGTPLSRGGTLFPDRTASIGGGGNTHSGGNTNGSNNTGGSNGGPNDGGSSGNGTTPGGDASTPADGGNDGATPDTATPAPPTNTPTPTATPTKTPIPTATTPPQPTATPTQVTPTPRPKNTPTPTATPVPPTSTPTPLPQTF